MKLGLISDIHGDMVALELAWAHLTVLGVDRIVCAGDLVGYGPHPDRVVAFLLEHGIESVRGNHDRWAVERVAGVPSVPSTFGGGMPSVETVESLRLLPAHRLVDGASKVGVIVHGSPGDDMDFVTRQTHPPYLLDRWLEEMNANVLIVGHTHKPGSQPGLGDLRARGVDLADLRDPGLGVDERDIPRRRERGGGESTDLG
jgi:putative phosphoesterase